VVDSRDVMSGEFKSDHNASLRAALKGKLRRMPAARVAFVTSFAIPAAPSGTPDALNAAARTRPR